MSSNHKKPRQLHLQIIDTLRHNIESGMYQPGDQFPTEMELAGEFGVSRGTLRRALQVLVDQGVLRRIAGKGTFVKPAGSAGTNVSGRSTLVGIAIPEIHDPLSSSLINGAQRVLHENGYSLIFCNLEGNPNTEREQFERLRLHRVAGVVLFPLSIPGELELLHELRASKTPVVLVDRQVAGFATSSVMADHFQGARDGVKHLLDLGHQRIACITHPVPASSVQERVRGYEQAMRAAGLLPYAAVSVLGLGAKTEQNTPPFYTADEMKLVDHMLGVRERPTAVFCVNDYLAIGVMRHVLAKGIRVPDDLAIVGFDNNPFAELAPVPLTTSAQPATEIGMKAVEVLLQYVDGKPVSDEPIRLPTQLIVRASSARQIA